MAFPCSVVSPSPTIEFVIPFAQRRSLWVPRFAITNPCKLTKIFNTSSGLRFIRRHQPGIICGFSQPLPYDHTTASDNVQEEDENYEEEDFEDEDEDMDTESEDNSELDDKELDSLFREHGVVVRSSESAGSLAVSVSGVDDDAESLAFAMAMAEVASEVKGIDIKVLHVKPLIYWAQYFVIATAFSAPQVGTMGFRMRQKAVEMFKKTARGDTKPKSWTLLDFGDVVVHIFLPTERSYYNLDEFYANATMMPLSFTAERSQRR